MTGDEKWALLKTWLRADKDRVPDERTVESPSAVLGWMAELDAGLCPGCGTFAQRPNCSCCPGCGGSPCRCEPHPGFEEL